MNEQLRVPVAGTWVDGLFLPETDGSHVNNAFEPLQSSLLTDSIEPVLQRRHPDGRFWTGAECGVYWRRPEPDEPPTRAAIVPDWCYVPDVPAAPEGQLFRRSYILWQEGVPPLVVFEYVSGDGREERDRTPQTGKFWIYEQGVRAPYYGIYDVERNLFEMHRLVKGHYRRQRPNARGHYPIKPLGVELGIWNGRFQNVELPWLRWYDAHGNLLLYGREEAEQHRLKAERLAERLRELGIDPEA
jgi:Uma2 family endonuclease